MPLAWNLSALDHNSPRIPLPQQAMRREGPALQLRKGSLLPLLEDLRRWKTIFGGSLGVLYLGSFS